MDSPILDAAEALLATTAAARRRIAALAHHHLGFDAALAVGRRAQRLVRGRPRKIVHGKQVSV